MASSKVSQCTEPLRNLLRQIEIASGEVNHVGKGIKVAVATGPIVNHPDDTVDAFGNGVGDSCIDEGNDGLLMLAQSTNPGNSGQFGQSQFERLIRSKSD